MEEQCSRQREPQRSRKELKWKRTWHFSRWQSSVRSSENSRCGCRGRAVLVGHGEDCGFYSKNSDQHPWRVLRKEVIQSHLYFKISKLWRIFFLCKHFYLSLHITRFTRQGRFSYNHWRNELETACVFPTLILTTPVLWTHRDAN